MHKKETLKMHLKMSVIEKKIIPPKASAYAIHHRDSLQRKGGLWPGLNCCDNLFTEQNCANTNNLLSLQVLVKKSMKLIM